MVSLIRVLVPVAAAFGFIAVASPHAQAAPPCGQYDTCQYLPNPYNAGPMMPTWELPGGSPAMCDPQAYSCYPAVPGSGFQTSEVGHV